MGWGSVTPVRLAEAFWLDGKIDKYKGARPITLYRWDLECASSNATSSSLHGNRATGRG